MSVFTLKNPNLYLAHTWLLQTNFLGTAGVRYRQVLLYFYFNIEIIFLLQINNSMIRTVI